MTRETFCRSALPGIAASTAILGAYFGIVSLISGRSFAGDQFASYWPFLLALSLGFGLQVSLYSYLKRLASALDRRASSKAIAVTGTTSAISMVSCCAHYLVNVLPVLGISGALMAVSAYQIELFWVGILFNIAGLAFIMRKITLIKKMP